MNQEIQVYLRGVINHAQTDWRKWLPAAQLALNGRYQPAIGTSPFFATHGYEATEPVPLREEPGPWVSNSEEKRAQEFIDRIHEAEDILQATMGAAGQKQEEAANRRRNPAPIFRVGDKVWLNLRNYKTERPKKKLDIRQAKYTVSEVISPLSIRLEGIPSNIENVFHPDLLRLASTDPLPGQETDDSQPDPVLLEGHSEWSVEEILCARDRKRGKGREVLVKWHGYRDKTWEPLESMEDTAALDVFEGKYGRVGKNDGPRELYEGIRRNRKGKKASSH